MRGRAEDHLIAFPTPSEKCSEGAPLKGLVQENEVIRHNTHQRYENLDN